MFIVSALVHPNVNMAPLLLTQSFWRHALRKEGGAELLHARATHGADNPVVSTRCATLITFGFSSQTTPAMHSHVTAATGTAVLESSGTQSDTAASAWSNHSPLNTDHFVLVATLRVERVERHPCASVPAIEKGTLDVAVVLDPDVVVQMAVLLSEGLYVFHHPDLHPRVYAFADIHLRSCVPSRRHMTHQIFQWEI